MSTIREIKDAGEYYDFLLSAGIQSTSYESFDFFTKFQNISKGCNCQKKNRISRATEAYVKAVTSANEEFQKLVKDTAKADTVRFLTLGALFFEY